MTRCSAACSLNACTSRGSGSTSGAAVRRRQAETYPLALARIRQLPSRAIAGSPGLTGTLLSSSEMSPAKLRGGQLCGRRAFPARQVLTKRGRPAILSGRSRRVPADHLVVAAISMPPLVDSSRTASSAHSQSSCFGPPLSPCLHPQSLKPGTPRTRCRALRKCACGVKIGAVQHRNLNRVT
jgi:hypothetical protein